VITISCIGALPAYPLENLKEGMLKLILRKEDLKGFNDEYGKGAKRIAGHGSSMP